MREYKIKYESAPVSEILKVMVIKAETVEDALEVFGAEKGDECGVFSIELAL